MFEKLFPKKTAQKKIDGWFTMLDGYVPAFSTYDGGVYEMELTRACIHAFANHCSKLLPVVTGADVKNLQKTLDTKPNFMMTSAQFLYKTATIYDTQNTCFILPVLDEKDITVGYYPANPQMVEIVSVRGEPFVRCTFGDGKKAAVELSRCGVVSKFLYKNDIKGETNAALNPTLSLIDLQNQGITEGIKNSASFRFMGQMDNFATEEDIEAERSRFVERNFAANKSGLILFPTFSGMSSKLTLSRELSTPSK